MLFLRARYYIVVPISVVTQLDLGAALVGFSLSLTSYGASLVQVYAYMLSDEKKDRIAIRVLVFMLPLLGTVAAVFLCHGFYTLLLLGIHAMHTNPVIPWSFMAESILSGVMRLLVQSFYAHQTWKVCRQPSRLIPLILLAFIAFGFNIVSAISLLLHPEFSSIPSRRFTTPASLSAGAAALCDTLVALNLRCYLYDKRGENIRSQKLVDALSLYITSRGILTILLQVLVIIFIQAAPVRVASLWYPFHLAAVRLHVNSLLASLNARSGLSGRSSTILCDSLHFQTSPPSRSALSLDEFLPSQPQLSDGEGGVRAGVSIVKRPEHAQSTSSLRRDGGSVQEAFMATI